MNRSQIKSIKQFVLILFGSIFLMNCSQNGPAVVINGGRLSIEFDRQLHSRIISRLDGKKVLGGFSSSEFITVNGEPKTDFRLQDNTVSNWKDKVGKGKEYRIKGSAPNMTKEVSVVSYDDFPKMLLLQVIYTNTGNADIIVDGWTNNHYTFNAIPRSDEKPPFWSYQPGSYGWDNDWVQQIRKGFERENYMGMNRVDYGGGTPVVDVWRQDVGIAVGHVEMVPKFVSLPVSMPSDEQVTMAVTYEKEKILKPGESLKTLRTFVAVHKGDHFRPLTDYGHFMVRQGIEFKEAPEGAYETIWCGWGYEKDFTMDKFYGTFPMVKKLGIDWVVLDYGWSTGVGDYYLPKDKFPNGDADMRKVVERIHAIGAKAKLWWMPLSAHPSTDMFQQHPENLLLDKDGSPVYIEFWRSFFLCPGSQEVQKITRDFVVKALKDWGFDGLKIDGNNLNMVPPCYNRRHHHAYPEESAEKLPELFKIIYETALSINPDAVIEICPCGTNQSFFILPYMNQTVASDPHNSWHIRLKGKTLKALTDSKSVFYGDHVELSDARCDFASTIGIGGVPGTKFTWPVGVYENKETGDIALTPEKERKWVKWLKIYKDKMLSKGVYRGELYDIGYDRPEAHAIEKDSKMYYAFYAPDYEGEVELRGLGQGVYKVNDYVNNKALGKVTADDNKLQVSFKKHLLIEVMPE